MSAFDLDDLQTQSGGLHSLLHVLYEASTEIQYVFPNGERDRYAERVSSLVILARDEAERLDANIGECIKSQNRERLASKTMTAVEPPQVDGGPIFEPAKLSLDELFGLYSGIRTVLDVANGLCCQPKFGNDKNLSPAGEMIDKLTDFLSKALADIHSEALARVPADAGERERKFFFIADHYVDGLTNPEYAMAELKKEVAKIGGAQ